MKQMLIRVRPLMKKMAILCDGDPVEFAYTCEGCEQTMGSIYKGRVDSVLPGMDAAFVDIGLRRCAFLHFCDAGRCGDDFKFGDEQTGETVKKPPVKVGDDIVVQVVKLSGGEKGVRLSANITLPGRRVVLLTDSEDVGVSRRITDEAERIRLRDMARNICPKGMGVIMRTAASGCDADTIGREIAFLSERWDNIRKRIEKSSAPALVHDDSDIVMRALRDRFDESYDEVLIDDRECYESALAMVRAWAPQLADRVHFWDQETEMFTAFGVDQRTAKLMNRKVWLKNGGYLVIDPTEALTVIDVNSGKCVGKSCHSDTILSVNLMAADEIARQMRLRDIGGIIIVDFIDMQSDEDKEAVRKRLAQRFAEDRTRTFIGEFSQLGLLEITRKKARHNIASILEEPCPYCRGEGVIKSEIAVISQAVRETENLLHHTDGDVLVRLHPTVAGVLTEKYAKEPIMRIPQGRRVFVQSLSCLHQATVQVEAVGPMTKLDGRDITVLIGGQSKDKDQKDK